MARRKKETVKQEKRDVAIVPNDGLPVSFVDSVALHMRRDGLCLCRFAVDLHEGWREQARLMIAPKNMKAILDSMCDVSDYYPTRPKK